jgi:hypothetical protein
MLRHAAVVGLCAAAWSGVARASDAATPPATSATETPANVPPAPSPGPGAELIQFAAREHDLGYRAYLDKQYDEAASHFENAFFAAPNPAELRSAIRARRDAGELARAATLAAIGLRRFPGDTATTKVAADVIAQARPSVHEVQISSPDEYSLAVDSKIVAAERVRETRLFVNPGAHELLVSWSEDRSVRIPLDAKAGGTQSLSLEPPAATAPPQPPSPPVASASPVVASLPPVAPPLPPEPSVPSKRLGPPVFVAGAMVTAVGAGFIVWSGIDTLHSPGTNAVRSSCSSGAANCRQLYQQGVNAQTRTNVAIGVTGAIAAATAVIGLFFTDWPGPAAGSGAVPKTRAITVALQIGPGQAGIDGTF